MPVHKNELEAGLCQSRQEDKKYQVKLLNKPIVVRRVATAMPGRANPQEKGAHASLVNGSSGAVPQPAAACSTSS